MECVIDTSALSWLERVGYVDLLPQIYQKIIAPPGVLRQLTDHYSLRSFVDNHITPLAISRKDQAQRFYRLVRRWKRKVELDDLVDAEVFVAYRFFTEANEALYANKGAEENLTPYGLVRDIARLYEVAEQAGIFTKGNSQAYLDSLLNIKPPYRPKYVKKLLSQLTLSAKV